MRLLRISDEARQMFFDYFNSGMTPAAAVCLHESKLMCQDNGVELLANAALNPTARSVYYLHNKWRKLHFGSVIDPLQKLCEKVSHYSNLGM